MIDPAKSHDNKERNGYLLKSDFWKIVAIGAIQTVVLLASFFYGAGILSNRLGVVETQVEKLDNRIENMRFPFDERKQEQLADLMLRLDRLEKQRDNDVKEGRLMSYKEKVLFMEQYMRDHKPKN